MNSFVAGIWYSSLPIWFPRKTLSVFNFNNTDVKRKEYKVQDISMQNKTSQTEMIKTHFFPTCLCNVWLLNAF